MTPLTLGAVAAALVCAWLAALGAWEARKDGELRQREDGGGRE